MAGPLLYELTVPLVRKALQNQVNILKEGEAWCKEKGIDVEDLGKARLVPDMFALPFQVQFCAFNAAKLLVDLNVLPNLDLSKLAIANPQAQQPFSGLISRLEKVIGFFDDLSPQAFEHKEDEAQDIKYGEKLYHPTGLQYAREWFLPGFEFHHVMVYSILRVQGVPLTKQMFLK